MTFSGSAFLRVLAVSALVTVPAALWAQAPPEYIKTVHDSVARVTVYPKMAKLHGQEGKVSCLVKIAATGALIDSSVDASSGTSALDQAALEAIKRAAPFPPPPNGDATLKFSLTFALAD
jgi:protein TonB